MFHRILFFFFFQAEDGIRDADVTGVQTCALPICYKTRPLDRTIRATVEWYRELMEAGAFGRRLSTLTVASAGMRVADRLGVMGGLRAAEGWVGRRLVTGT